VKKILFIINPRAGVDRSKAIETALQQHLDHQQYQYEIAETQYPKHGTAIAKDAVASGIDVVVAVGGDGSLNDIIQGIHNTDTVLGVIPMGSGNGLARSAGIPLKLEAAIKVLNKNNVHAIDSGMVDNKRLFISNAGVGFDAVVTEEFVHSKKRGFWSYVGIINKKIWSYSPKKWTIELDGKVIREKAFMITVANATQLGYNFQIAPVALMNDGYFDVVVIRKHPKILSGIIGLQAFTDTLLNNRYVNHYKAKSVKISSESNRVMQMDGEAIDCASTISIEMSEKSIKLLCP